MPSDSMACFKHLDVFSDLNNLVSSFICAEFPLFVTASGISLGS